MASLPPRPPALTLEEYENVCKCRHTPLSEKRAYLAQIAGCGADRSRAAAVHAIFRRGKLRGGTAPSSLYADEGLGVLVVGGVFVDKTAKAFGMSPRKLRGKFSNWLSYERKRSAGRTPTERERLDAWAFRDANVPTRQDGEIWLFRNPQRKQDAFEGVLDDWLGARLGLILKPGEPRLTFGFLARSVKNLAEPRFYDATWQYLSNWHWNGRTRPLKDTPPGHTGLEEVVGDPPKLRDLSRPVVAVTMRIP
jgi:hypothetical protein